MALIEDGSERMGDWLEFPVGDGKIIRAQVVDPVFYDKAGEKQDA